VKLKKALIGTAIVISTVSCAHNIKINNPDMGKEYSITHQVAAKRFHDFAKNGSYEEAWIVYGDKVLDICNTEELMGWNGSLDFIVEKINKSEHDEIIFVHTHPIKAQEKITNYPTNILPPTSIDYALFAKVQSHPKYKGGRKFKGEVYDGYGVWKFHFTEELDKQLNEKAKEGFSPISGPLYGNIIRLLETELAISIDKSKGEKIKNYIKSIGELGIILEYIEY